MRDLEVLLTANSVDLTSDAIEFVKANETFEHAPRLLGISTDHNWTSTDDAELLRAPVTSSFVSDVFSDGTNETSAYAH